MSENILEELFALKYELNALAEVTLKNEAERWLPRFIHKITEHDHIERYKFASQFAAGKKVLDIACGVGRGSFMLQTLGQAKSVIGCDLDQNAIRYARHRHASEHLVFKVENAESFLSNEPFDLIVSFETIEHLPDYDAFLMKALKNLKAGGLLIISTPISKMPFDKAPNNPYHVQEWGFTEFQDLLSKYFKVEHVYTQLYQNEFYNEKIKTQYFKDTEFKPTSIARRILSRIFKRSAAKLPTLDYRYTWNSPENHSVLEKFTGQFDIEKLGTYYSGYQVLICRREGE